MYCRLKVNCYNFSTFDAGWNSSKMMYSCTPGYYALARLFGGLLIEFFSNKTLFLLNKKWSSIWTFKDESSSIGKGSTNGVRTVCTIHCISSHFYMFRPIMYCICTKYKYRHSSMYLCNSHSIIVACSTHS